MASIALIGPDGAGKTTITRMLVESRLLPFKYLYMGINTSSSNLALPTSRLAERLKAGREGGADAAAPAGGGRRAAFRAVWATGRLLNRIAEEMYRQTVSWWYQARGYVVLYDRHFTFDFAPGVEVRNAGSLDRRLHRWFLRHLYPRPGLVILLDAPGEVLFARKREATPAELERRRQALRREGERLPNFVVVDATGPVAATFAEVRRQICLSLGREEAAAPPASAPRAAAVAATAPARPAGRSRLRVLTYHRVLEPTGLDGDCPSVVSATPRGFARQMEHLARHYRVVSAEELIEVLRGHGRLPERAVLITFDDAYRDVGEVAWPILRRLGLPATVFVPTAFPDHPERSFWWDRLHRAVSGATVPFLELAPLGRLPLADPSEREASFRRLADHLKHVPQAAVEAQLEGLCQALRCTTLAPNEVLGWDALRELAADGLTLAAHTRTHPALTGLPREEARAEIRGSLDDLLRQTGRPPVRIFAYPFGIHDASVVALLREEGFEAAVTTLAGQNELGRVDPLCLHRTNVGVRTTPALFRVRMLSAFERVDAWRREAFASRPLADGSAL